MLIRFLRSTCAIQLVFRSFGRRSAARNKPEQIKKGGLQYLKMLKQSQYSLDYAAPPVTKSKRVDKEIPTYVQDPLKYKKKLKDIDKIEEEQKQKLNQNLSFSEPNKKKEKKTALQLIEDKMKGLVPPNSEPIDRLDHNYISQYEAEYKLKRRLKKYREETSPPPGPQTFIKPANIKEFQSYQRLSKRLSRMGVCSRKQAQRLIESGVVKVDGKLISQNTLVDDTSRIEIHNKRLATEKPDSKLWLFHKPQGLICTHHDPEQRVNIFQRVKDLGLQMPHLISIGRLDLMSEGLILLTNDGDLANALEHPSSRLERDGMMIGSEFYGPYVAEVEKRQSTNTWLHMKLYQGKNREIRKVMQKLSLRVNRLQRVRYGPYSIKEVPMPNDLRQVPVKQSIRKIVQKFYSKRLREAQSEIAHVSQQVLMKKTTENKKLGSGMRPSLE